MANVSHGSIRFITKEIAAKAIQGPTQGYERMQDGHKLAFVPPGELRRMID
jgi:hypothetical protein